MNNSDFVKEVTESQICPSDFEEVYKKFTIYQNAAIDTIKEFHRVCEKNGVWYQLAYGSLLGAIRDGGQIPWDYDVDVFVDFHDREKLISALKKDLNEDFYFYCPEVAPGCRHVIMRLAPKEYRTEAIHVDVFYLTGTPDDPKLRKAHIQKIRYYSKCRVGKLISIKEESLGNVKRFLYIVMRHKIPTFFMSLKNIQKRYEELCSKYPMKKTKYCFQADGDRHTPIFESSLLWDTKLYRTALGELRIPVNYESLLEMEYGDFMRYPSLESRIKEVYHSYNRISKITNR